jgi:hypothetical protein
MAISAAIELVRTTSFRIPVGEVDGSNADFELAHAPKAGTLRVFKNGLLQRGGGNDYALAGTTITFVAGAIPTGLDSITVTYSY